MAATTTAVPDSRRSALIDRRTVAPALLVLALAVLMSIVLPYIDNHTDYRHQIQRGDVAQVAQGITLVPASGWDLATGALVGHARTPVQSTATTQLVNGGVKFSVQAAPFRGGPSALLARLNKIGHDLNSARASTRHYRVTTKQGARGVAEDFVGANRQGSVVAFVFNSPAQAGGGAGQPTREGVAVIVSGPSGPVARLRDHVVAMIRSLRVGS